MHKNLHLALAPLITGAKVILATLLDSSWYLLSYSPGGRTRRV